MPLLEVKFQPHISPGECIQANMRVARDASAQALGVNLETIAVEATPFSEHRIGTADEEFTLRASGSLIIAAANMLDARPEKTFVRSKYTLGTIEQAAHKVTNECLLLYTGVHSPKTRRKARRQSLRSTTQSYRHRLDYHRRTLGLPRNHHPPQLKLSPRQPPRPLLLD